MKAEITFEELKEAAIPLVKLLREKGHPHMTVVVKDDRVELVEGVKGCPLEYED